MRTGTILSLAACALLAVAGCQSDDIGGGGDGDGDGDGDGARQNRVAHTGPAHVPAGERMGAASEDWPADLPPGPQLALPATFAGILPCADCEGIAYHLDLWPDGVYHLRQTYLGEDGAFLDRGQWRRDPTRPALFLHGSREAPQRFAVLDPRRLRMLDRRGRPIASELDYELASDGTLTPLVIEGTLRGMFTDLADAPRLRECLTGRSYPVAMEGAYIDLERAYTRADKPAAGAPLLVTIEGKILPRPAMEGDREVPTVVVSRFVELSPGEACAPALATASLPDQCWRLTSLDGEALPDLEGHHEAYLILRGEDQRFVATVGCNRILGRWEVQGPGITLTPGPATLMACPEPLDAAERRLVDVLGRARAWSITGRQLELKDADGATVATCEAAYLR